MRRILIVEDDGDMLELLRIVFRDSGYDVTFSNRALEIDDIMVLRPNLILLDVTLESSPKSGAAICRELKSDPATHEIPIILISGEPNLAKIAKLCNANAYFAKPLDMLGLQVIVNKFLN
ncbi:response regulator [Dyadobacter chenhuakuii]|uniref:Response regulator n=1 Tax=Dyadobacter chenhuakuii TaxID=2909339 RepID=A0ABY4XLD8_9BACT|nr:response regulator [Dyadobacter chenhuakuii]MCF2494124.1 response regulator [Dyadobacter chenhuakuii]USJ31252.1 response regulator [Dyadobacter chenhuakuii]